MNVPGTMSRAALPRVDVIVPCYGYGHLLTDCVDSIRRQTGVEARVVIVDDASPDCTPEVAHGLAASDGRIDVIRHDHNRGHIATFNHGLSLVDAEYVAVVSADDRLTEGALRRAVDTLCRHPSAGFVYGRVRHFDRAWHEPRQVPLGTTVWPGEQWLAQRCRRPVNVISSPEVVMRTATQRQVGGFEPSLPHTADLHLWLRLASVADVAFVRGRTQAGYRVHASSLQRTVHAGALLDLTERVTMFRHLRDHAWCGRPDTEVLTQYSLAALAREALERARRLRERRRPLEAERFEALALDAAPASMVTPRSTSPRDPMAAVGAGLRRRLERTGHGLRREVFGW